jgi:hypothetical protein
MFTNLTNTILRADTLHPELGKSKIVYFHKKRDPTTLTNYRGIALQSVLYKIAAALTAKQVLAACDSLGLMCSEQVAARKHGRAGDHVATMTAGMADAVRNSRELHIVTCDIQKAFDEVPRAALAEALARHGFPQEVGSAQGLHAADVRWGHCQDPLWQGRPSHNHAQGMQTRVPAEPRDILPLYEHARHEHEG